VTNSVAGVRTPEAAGQAGGQDLVIAVDGPSGSGKSSAARGTATALGLRYLDTGAMYRAVTWWMLEHNVDLADTGSVTERALGLTIEVSTDPAERYIRVDGIDVTAQIRTRRVSNVVSLVAAVPEVRSQLIAQQQAIIADAVATAGGIVAEGRDIGSVVAPGAPLKVFLTASEQVRADRRAAELAGRQVAAAPASGRAAATAPATALATAAVTAERTPPSADLTRAEQAQRDRRDAAQSQMAADAIKIDATELGLDDVIGRIVGLARARRAGE
jgi:cytidylate kinase